MNQRSRRELERCVPALAAIPYRITSKADKKYNCVAWSVSETRRWWEPARFWPLTDRTDYSVAAYTRAFGTLGFVPCENYTHEAGFEKIAVYESLGEFTHSARQLPATGKWTSKIGKLQDIEHDTPQDLAPIYGTVVAVLRRRIPAI